MSLSLHSDHSDRENRELLTPTMGDSKVKYHPESPHLKHGWDGYLGSLTDKQKTKLREMMSEFEDEDVSVAQIPKEPKETMFLRFLRARQFSVSKASTMLRKCIHFKTFEIPVKKLRRRNPDEILGCKESEINKYWPQYVHGTDRFGRLVLIFKAGILDAKSILKLTTIERYVEYLVWRMERIRTMMYVNRKRTGYFTESTLLIFDMAGFSIRRFNSEVRQIIKRFTNVMQDYYPESNGKTFVINTVSLFKIIWSFASALIDRRTRLKVSLMTSKFHKKLYEDVDPYVLPKDLGGQQSELLLDRPVYYIEFENDSFAKINREKKKRLLEEERLEMEKKMKLEKEKKIKLEKEKKIKLEREKKIKLEREKKIKLEREKKIKLEMEKKMKLEMEKKMKLEMEKRMKLERKEKMKLEREEKMKLEREEKMKLEREEKEEAERQLKLNLERKKKQQEKVERLLRERREKEKRERERREKVMKEEKIETKRQMELKLEREKKEREETILKLQKQNEEKLLRERKERENQERKESENLEKREKKERERQEQILEEEKEKKTKQLYESENIIKRDQDVKNISSRETTTTITTNIMKTDTTTKGHVKKSNRRRKIDREIRQPRIFDSQTKIASCRDFVLKIRIDRPSEIVVQFTSTVSRIGFQILMNDYEVGDGLCIVSGGYGQISGDVVCVEEGILRIRWDNHYKDSNESFKSADVRYHITCTDIDSAISYENQEELDEDEPIGGFVVPTLMSSSTSVSSSKSMSSSTSVSLSTNEKHNIGSIHSTKREDDCTIQ